MRWRPRALCTDYQRSRAGHMQVLRNIYPAAALMFQMNRSLFIGSGILNPVELMKLVILGLRSREENGRKILLSELDL